MVGNIEIRQPDAVAISQNIPDMQVVVEKTNSV